MLIRARTNKSVCHTGFFEALLLGSHIDIVPSETPGFVYVLESRASACVLFNDRGGSWSSIASRTFLPLIDAVAVPLKFEDNEYANM
jgi:hypothetical protein